MTIKSIWLRRIHKWVGLVIGLQVLAWTISGTAMALLDMDEVAGGPAAMQAQRPLAGGGPGWSQVQQALADKPVTALTVRNLPQGPAYQVTTTEGVHLFDTADGAPLTVGAAAASAIAAAAHPEGAPIRKVEALDKIGFAVRDHQLPIWRVDFADAKNSSYYVSGSTGELLERRNDAWRWWDFFWMLHIMDYSERSSFNHPLIIIAGFSMVWLAVTGFWLLFRTMWRHDFAWVRRLRRARG